jgi:hypothetical protein
MNLSERVDRHLEYEKLNGEWQSLEHTLLRDLIADWKRLKGGESETSPCGCKWDPVQEVFITSDCEVVKWREGSARSLNIAGTWTSSQDQSVIAKCGICGTWHNSGPAYCPAISEQK